MAALAVGFAALAAPAEAAGQERLHLETFGDEALGRLALKLHGEKTIWELEDVVGVEGSLARGATPAYDRPFAVAGDLGFGWRRTATDLIQLRSQMSVPLPVAPGGKPGPFRVWDLDGANRLRAQIGLGGTEGDRLAKRRGGADLAVEGAVFQGGTYGTTFVRQDIGPHPFVDADGRATVAPRLALDHDAAIALPVTAELREVEVDRPDGIFSYQSRRFSSGIGLKPAMRDISHGWLEAVGAGWEQASFKPPAPAAGAANPVHPKLGGVEKFDFRALHVDGLIFAGSHDVAAEITTYIGGNWLRDPTGSARTTTVSGALSGMIRGYFEKDGGPGNIAVGFGLVHDALFMADGSALTRRWRFEGVVEGRLLDSRVGWSARTAAEQLTDIGTPFRGAVAADWYLAPIRHLQLGMLYTSTQQCVSAATAAGPAWCHRAGLFVRAAFDANKTLPDDDNPPPEPPPPEVPPPQAAPPPPPPAEPVKHVAQ